MNTLQVHDDTMVQSMLQLVSSRLLGSTRLVSSRLLGGTRECLEQGLKCGDG